MLYKKYSRDKYRRYKKKISGMQADESNVDNKAMPECELLEIVEPVLANYLNISMSPYLENKVDETILSTEHIIDYFDQMTLEPEIEENQDLGPWSNVLITSVEEVNEEKDPLVAKDFGDNAPKSEINVGCVICHTNAVNTVIIPCMHVCICVDCTVEYIKKNNTCPFCRKEIEKIEKVYICGKNLS